MFGRKVKACKKHSYFFKGYIPDSGHGKEYCFECEHCGIFCWMKFNAFWGRR